MVTSLQGVGLGFWPFTDSSAVQFVHVLLQVSSVWLEHAAVWWLLPRHFEVTFFRWVNSKLSLPPFKVLWSTALWHLSVGRCWYVSLANCVLCHSFHTQCWFIYMLSFKCLCCHACVILSGIFCPIIFIAVRIEVKCFSVARLYLCKRFWCSGGHSVNTEIG